MQLKYFWLVSFTKPIYSKTHIPGNLVAYKTQHNHPGTTTASADFYQHFFPILGPLLLKTFTESFRNKELPPSLNMSYIILIPKGNSDKTQLKNYRPISLLNVDYKIFAKTLTNKVKPHMLHSYTQTNNAALKTETFTTTHTSLGISSPTHIR